MADADDPQTPERRRRPRYSGTHPRRFEEKYKERDPLRFAETVARVEASGKTAAGSHRPICVAEILRALEPKAGETVVDATLGHGGHSLAILPRVLPGGCVIALDADPLELPRAERRIREAGYGPESFVALHANMAALPKMLGELGIAAVDAVVADLGCSSMQLDDPSRGFSFKREGPLDLRMNPRRGKPAAEMVATLDETRLAAILEENADERRAAAIARAIVAARERAPLVTTLDLASAVRGALPASADDAAVLARVFQALRMEVNGESSALEAFLRALPAVLAPGGRVAVLAFHSGEDRRVKRAFAEGWRAGDYGEMAREVVRPSSDEVRANPRASSAKLRWAVRATE
jgi:16S rRNA (cytosine1402-N4)-methyltransferase